MKKLIAYTIMYMIFVLALHARAEEKITATITPPSAASPDDGMVGIDAIWDNMDGTATAEIRACGSSIRLVVPNSMIKRQDPKVDETANQLIRTACKAHRS